VPGYYGDYYPWGYGGFGVGGYYGGYYDPWYYGGGYQGSYDGYEGRLRLKVKPRQAEVFVTRDDRFDCVTFCETVLAAAKAQDVASFEAELRAIRYRKGVVEWRERNHDCQ